MIESMEGCARGFGQQYKVRKWVRMGQVGYIGAEDEGAWPRTEGSDWEGEEEVKEVKEETPPPQRPKHHPPNPQPPILVVRNSPKRI